MARFSDFVLCASDIAYPCYLSDVLCYRLHERLAHGRHRCPTCFACTRRRSARLDLHAITVKIKEHTVFVVRLAYLEIVCADQISAGGTEWPPAWLSTAPSLGRSAVFELVRCPAHLHSSMHSFDGLRAIWVPNFNAIHLVSHSLLRHL